MAPLAVSLGSLCLAQAACRKDGCPFSAVSGQLPPDYKVTRCGQVDAAPRMPNDIWKDPHAVELYVNFTIKLWSLHVTPPILNFAFPLRQLACSDHTETYKPTPTNPHGPHGNHTVTVGPYPHGPHGSQQINWSSNTLMKMTCDVFCDCTYPNCPDVPDKPGAHRYCSLCGPKFNAPINVSYYFSVTPPATPGVVV